MEDVGVDPDIPDEIRDEDLQGDLEGDEGFCTLMSTLNLWSSSAIPCSPFWN